MTRPTRLLHHLVDVAAEVGPDREAVSDGRTRLSYEELAAQSTQLARLLVDEGVNRGDRVGILLPRCIESALAVYGTLKAGAAFVPIDPNIPPSGIRQLVRACGIKHLISQDSLLRTVRETLKDQTSIRCIIGPDPEVEGVRVRPWSDLERYSTATLSEIRVLEDDLAYVMFSSGSTGRPKGIMHTHRSGLAYAEASAETYSVCPEDRIGNHSPLHFDMSTFGYFSGPYAQATTVIIPEAHTKLTASLTDLIESERLTIWYSVPLALIQLLLRGGLEGRDFSPLRWVLFGGEPFPPNHLRALMEYLPGAQFSNVYGPAETNQCTYYNVPPLDDPSSEAMNGQAGPIGRTWEYADELVLDDQDRPVSNGQQGELMIRSATMMQGYWSRPDLDDRAFFRLRLSAGPDRIFYRTGDIVRRREDGELIFLGRKDRQVKVRGYRVELDDIEHSLGTHPAVEEAAAFSVREGDGLRHIEAAVTLIGGDTADEDQLRSFLGSTLSWYAVPQRIVILESFPRTGSDKIDRKQLQANAES